MSLYPRLPGRAYLAAFTLLLVGGAAACEEDGKSLPATCPTLALYDAHAGGHDWGGDPGLDKGVTDTGHCLTNIGYAVNQIGPSGGTTSTTGGTGGKGGTGGTGGKSSAGGKGGKGGTSASDGGAGGAG